ncbi:MAG: porin family protein [Rhodanobacteraceae bacterium]|nr:porin family protein [Rhodanobacteraceae bacterium]
MNVKIVTAMAAAIVAGICSAGAARADGFFVDGRYGRSDFDSSGKDTALGINGGYRWGAFGLEGGYVDLGSLDRGYTGSSGLHSGIDVAGWTLGANGHFNLTPNWYLSARAGLFHWKADMDLVASPTNAKFSGNDWYAGAGVGYDFSERFSLGLNYDHYRAGKSGMDFDANVISVNTEFRF